MFAVYLTVCVYMLLHWDFQHFHLLFFSLELKLQLVQLLRALNTGQELCLPDTSPHLTAAHRATIAAALQLQLQ